MQHLKKIFSIMSAITLAASMFFIGNTVISNYISGIKFAPKNGDSPLKTVCVPDADALAQESQGGYNAEGVREFVVEIIYSPKCHASWGRITTADKGERDMITTIAYFENNPNSRDTQYEAEEKTNLVFTNMLFYPELEDTRVCVKGTVKTGADIFEITPVCA